MRKMTNSFEAKKNENAYFVAANGYNGFRCYYKEVFHSSKFTRVFVIKGGPGTGKSRLLREVAVSADSIGATADYIYCSSDPASLDGVILRRGNASIAVMDATAPHTRCADVPGAIDEILNLGDFWDNDSLSEKRSEILRLSEEKSAAYQEGYRYLRLAGSADKECTDIWQKCFLFEKAGAAIERLLRPFKESRGKVNDVILSAIGMKGRVFFEVLRHKAASVYCVHGDFSAIGIYFSLLTKALSERKLAYIRLESPFSADLSEGVFLPKNKVLILPDFAVPKGTDIDKIINLSRFTDKKRVKPYAASLRRLERMRSDMLMLSENAFQKAGEAHFALERIYSEKMDFTRKEEASLLLTKRIFGILSDEVDNFRDV